MSFFRGNYYFLFIHFYTGLLKLRKIKTRTNHSTKKLKHWAGSGGTLHHITTVFRKGNQIKFWSQRSKEPSGNTASLLEGFIRCDVSATSCQAALKEFLFFNILNVMFWASFERGGYNTLALLRKFTRKDERTVWTFTHKICRLTSLF